MNILIIGNGFDLAHKLPTTYTAFLKFIEQVLRIKRYNGSVVQFESKDEKTGYDKFNELDEYVRKYIHSKISSDKKDFATVKETFEANNDPILKDLIALSENNAWIKWFQKQKEFSGENWIDFEAEIYKVVKCMEHIKQKSINDLSPFENEIAAHFKFINMSRTGKIDVLQSKKGMLDDLNALTRCLELYLEDCVRNIDKQLLSLDIYELNIDKVLSFNYTDTYSRIYSGKHSYVEYDYIHGKSKISVNAPNNMVLGIDEYLSDYEQLSNIDFIEFKKFFQRIHKMTGCKYKQWLEEITRSKNNKNNAYFFGHSLAKTDKDVLLEILNNEKITTTIFYHNSKQYAELIANLVQLLGDDEVISRVYSVNPRIIFQKQHDMIDRYNSEWEILNDCRSLRRIYALCDKDIENLIEKIQRKIDEQDLIYFHSQRNVISMYDALVSNFEIENESQRLNIAKALYDHNNYEIFDPDEWNDYDYSGTTVFCTSETIDFISDLNDFNYNKSIEKLEFFETDDLNLLYEQLSQFNIDDNKARELLDLLFLTLKKDNTNIDLCWKCIFLLIEKIPYEDIALFIDEGLSSENAIERARFKYLKDVIDENNYHKTMAEDTEQDDEYMSEPI